MSEEPIEDAPSNPRINAAWAPVTVAAAAVACLLALSFQRLTVPLAMRIPAALIALLGLGLIYANAAARELFRTSRETAPLVTVVRDPRILEAVDEALFGKIAGESVYEAGGVQDRVWRARTRPLGQRDGRALALLVLRDETELRRSERTRADFLANASHELRTPLASLAGFIETLRGHARDDPAARDRFLAIMHDQAARMARLIEDLMSLSRIELNEHIPPQGRADLRMTVKDVLDALAPLASEKCVRFEARLPDAPAVVQPADRDQVLQVIQNLAENALKYAVKGSSVVIEVASGVTAEMAMSPSRSSGAHLSLLTPDHAVEQRYVLLRVSDTGAGMAREHLPRLTERFYRVEGQRGGDRTGTGLGLAIVKHIMNRHRGGLAVESAPGEGAVFTAYFPMAPEHAARMNEVQTVA
jgi:two-component system phosphate regulon sensor histidine kinase PhoR